MSPVNRAVSLWLRVPLLPRLALPVLVLLALTATYVTNTILSDPYQIDFSMRNLPPWPMDGSSSTRLLGSDQLGRDILSRIVLGARFSLWIAGGAIVIGTLVGTAVGVVSAYVGGWIDGALMRLVDIVLAFPSVLIALVFVTVTGASFAMVITILTISVSSRFARVIRTEAITWMNRDFVLLAAVSGASPTRIMWRHILPNMSGTMIVLATLQIGYVVVAEATLSFLNAGVPPPDPTWGNMIAEGRDYIATQWWVAVIPGVAIAITVVSFNVLGDWVRDVLDPNLEQPT